MSRQDDIAAKAVRKSTLKSIKEKKQVRLRQLKEDYEKSVQEINIQYSEDPERLKAKYAAENYDKNLLPSKESAEAHLALMQLHQLRDCYRQGWVPDWNNVNQNKYCIENHSNTHHNVSYTASVHFLAFQTDEITEEFLHNFEDLIKKAGDLI